MTMTIDVNWHGRLQLSLGSCVPTSSFLQLFVFELQACTRQRQTDRVQCIMRPSSGRAAQQNTGYTSTVWERISVKSESECKCLTCNQKPTRSQFSLLHDCTNQTKRLMEKLKRKPLSSPVSVKAAVR